MTRVERLREQAKKIQTELREAESTEAKRVAARGKKRLENAARKSGLTSLLGDGKVTGSILEKEFKSMVERLKKAPNPSDFEGAGASAEDSLRSGIFNR